MMFLGKIRGMLGGSGEPAPISEPLPRNRTFSASQFRDAEMARAAEASARTEAMQINAAEVLSPAINPVAETLMAADPESADPLPAVPEPTVVPPAQTMAWDEAVGWLSQRSVETRNFVGQYWNWDYDLKVLHFLAQQPDLDAGVAAHIFWITAASEDYLPFGDDEPDSEVAQQIAWLTDFLGRRFAEGAFLSSSYGFDDSWDCERLKERLAELHAEGRLEWSPDAIPTASQAELMTFDDIPEEEREEVTGFLAQFGVY
jgi:hypothetical protein